MHIKATNLTLKLPARVCELLKSFACAPPVVIECDIPSVIVVAVVVADFVAAPATAIIGAQHNEYDDGAGFAVRGSTVP